MGGGGALQLDVNTEDEAVVWGYQAKVADLVVFSVNDLACDCEGRPLHRWQDDGHGGNHSQLVPDRETYSSTAVGC